MAALPATAKRYDAILVDAYRQPYIPFYLATKEFFALARSRLRPGGIVVVNAGHPEGSNKLEQVLGATMGAVFSTVLRDPSEDVNTLLLGTAATASAQRLRANVATLPLDLQPLARNAAERIEPRLRGERIYTDDIAPVEWLIDTSIVEFAAGDQG